MKQPLPPDRLNPRPGSVGLDAVGVTGLKRKKQQKVQDDRVN